MTTVTTDWVLTTDPARATRPDPKETLIPLDLAADADPEEKTRLFQTGLAWYVYTPGLHRLPAARPPGHRQQRALPGARPRSRHRHSGAGEVSCGQPGLGDPGRRATAQGCALHARPDLRRAAGAGRAGARLPGGPLALHLAPQGAMASLPAPGARRSPRG